MPPLNEIVRYRLCNTYLGDFSITNENPNKFTITITGSEQSYFKTQVHNRDNNRLIISIEPEKYGADFLRAASTATPLQKETFCILWKSIGVRYIEITINGIPVSPETFFKQEPNWQQFKLRFSKAPFYNPDTESRDDLIVNYIEKCMSMIFALVNIQIEGFAEGKEKYSVSKTYERNPINKQICLTAKGYTCEACGVKLEHIYGAVAHNFIEVHHSITVASMKGNYIVKPVEDLHPLCPNCHAIAHRKNPPYSIEEIKGMIAATKLSAHDNNSIAAEPIEPYGQPIQ